MALGREGGVQAREKAKGLSGDERGGDGDDDDVRGGALGCDVPLRQKPVRPDQTRPALE